MQRNDASKQKEPDKTVWVPVLYNNEKAIKLLNTIKDFLGKDFFNAIYQTRNLRRNSNMIAMLYIFEDHAAPLDERLASLKKHLIPAARDLANIGLIKLAQCNINFLIYAFRLSIVLHCIFPPNDKQFYNETKSLEDQDWLTCNPCEHIFLFRCERRIELIPPDYVIPFLEKTGNMDILTADHHKRITDFIANIPIYTADIRALNRAKKEKETKMASSQPTPPSAQGLFKKPQIILCASNNIQQPLSPYSTSRFEKTGDPVVRRFS